jgi:hypothetical protein
MTEIIVAWEPNAETDKRLLQVHAYWTGICHDGRPPERVDFSPAAIPHLLPWILLVDVLDNPRDFRFRLVGTAFTQIVRQDLTGLRVTEAFPPEFASRVLDGWNEVIANGGPNWARGKLWKKEREFIHWQGVILPFWSPGGAISQLLAAAAFHFSDDSLVEA